MYFMAAADLRIEDNDAELPAYHFNMVTITVSNETHMFLESLGMKICNVKTNSLS